MAIYSGFSWIFPLKMVIFHCKMLVHQRVAQVFPCFTKVLRIWASKLPDLAPPFHQTWEVLQITMLSWFFFYVGLDFQPLKIPKKWLKWHGSLNVPIEHHPTIRYMVYNGYYKVMSNIPKMGHLPIPEWSNTCLNYRVKYLFCIMCAANQRVVLWPAVSGFAAV